MALLIHYQAGSTTSGRPSTIASTNNFAHLDAGPFDGLALNIGTTYSFLAPGNVASYSTILGELNPIQGRMTKCIHHYARINVRGTQDVFDDWTQIQANWVTLAQACKDSGTEGIYFDNEEYTANEHVWTYPTNCKYSGSKSLSQYQEQWRLRGNQIMTAMISVFPTIRIIHAHTAAWSQTGTPNFVWGGGGGPSSGGGAYMNGFFYAGQLAASPGFVIDGGEDYAFRTPADFSASYNWLHNTWPTLAPSVVPASLTSTWATKYKTAFGVYDQPWPTNLTMDATQLKGCITNALNQADYLVWFYAEGNDYLTNGATLPAGYMNAVVTGKAAANPSTTVLVAVHASGTVAPTGTGKLNNRSALRVTGSTSVTGTAPPGALRPVAATYYVDAVNGQDANTGLSQVAAFQTIPHAVSVAANGSTVIVSPGIYAGGIFVTTPNLTFKTSSRAKGAVIVSNATILASSASWSVYDAPTNVYRIAYAAQPDCGRLIADGGPAANPFVDHYRYPSVASLKSRVIPGDYLTGVATDQIPGPIGGYVVTGGFLYLRLDPAYGTSNPGTRTIYVGLPPGSSGQGAGVNSSGYTGFSLRGTGTQNALIDGFTFLCAGAAGVYCSSSGNTIQNCYSFGNYALVQGNANSANQTLSANNVTVQYCEHGAFPAFKDALQQLADATANPGAYTLNSTTCAPNRFWWWIRKYGANYGNTYEAGIVGRGAGTGWKVYHNYVHDLVDGIDTAWAASCDVQFNLFESLLDNAVEWEDHGLSPTFSNNFCRNVFEPLSWQPLGGSPYPGPCTAQNNTFYDDSGDGKTFLQGVAPYWRPAAMKLLSPAPGVVAPGPVTISSNTFTTPYHYLFSAPGWGANWGPGVFQFNTFWMPLDSYGNWSALDQNNVTWTSNVFSSAAPATPSPLFASGVQSGALQLAGIQAVGTVSPSGSASVGNRRPITAQGTVSPTGIATADDRRSVRVSGTVTVTGSTTILVRRGLRASGAPTPLGVATPLAFSHALLAFGVLFPSGTLRLGSRRGLRASGAWLPGGTVRPSGVGALRALGAVRPTGTAALAQPQGIPVPAITLAVPAGTGFRVSGLLSIPGPLYDGFAYGGSLEVDAFLQTGSSQTQVWSKVSPNRDLTVTPLSTGVVDLAFHASDLPYPPGSTVLVNVRVSSPSSILTWPVGSFLINIL